MYHEILYDSECNFFRKFTFFSKSFIQVEKLEEPNFWEIEPLPQIIFDSSKQNLLNWIRELGSTNLETLNLILVYHIWKYYEWQKNWSNLEPMVYFRRNILDRSKNHLFFQAHIHNKSSSEVHPNILGNLDSIDPSSFLPFILNPDEIAFPESSLNPIPIIPIQESYLLIALRKEPELALNIKLSNTSPMTTFLPSIELSLLRFQTLWCLEILRKH